MANEFAEGTNRITAILAGRDQVAVAQLSTCLSVEYTEVLNDAGTWSARFPANDPLLDRVLLKKHFLDFYVDGTLLVRGLAETQDWELGNDGQQILLLSGRDLLAELDEVTIDFLLVTSGVDPEPTDIAPDIIINQYNSQVTGYSGSIYTWFVMPSGQTDGFVYGQYAGESALSALRRVAEQTGEAFRLIAHDNPLAIINGVRSVEWLGTTTASSGVRAVGGAPDISAENNPFICFIQNLTERRDAKGMFARIKPYGSGLGETRLDLEGVSASKVTALPAGFTYNAADNSITNDTALAYVGKLIGRHVNFKEIRPLFNMDADIQYAKDFLFDAALAYLQRNDSVDDVVEYDLDVLQLPAHVMAGMTLRVVWQDDLRTLDTDFVILGIRTVVGSNGERTYALTVATTNQWRFRETSNIVATVEEGQIFGAHPQIDANSYWKAYKEIVGDDQEFHMAEFPFFLSAEVLTIRQVLFRYQVGRPLIAVKSYALAANNTDLNDASVTGGTNTTATAGTNTVGTGGTNTAFTQDTNTAATAATAPGTSDSGGASATGDTPAGTTDTSGNSTTGSSSSGATDNNAVSVTGDSPAGATDTNGSGTTTSSGGSITSNESGPGDPHNHTTPNHTHPTPAHSHITTNVHSHTTPAHNHITTGTHSHTTPNHSHIVTAVHSHTTPAHTHAHAATHTHNMPHQHNMPHNHNMPHTHNMPHDHAAPQHVHDLPALIPTFNMEFIDASVSYIMADLEFAVNGGGWTSLDVGIPVAGGWTELDITPDIQNPAGLKRPYQEHNFVQVRRKTASDMGKVAQIRVELGIRCTVQSVVVYD